MDGGGEPVGGLEEDQSPKGGRHVSGMVAWKLGWQQGQISWHNGTRVIVSTHRNLLASMVAIRDDTTGIGTNGKDGTMALSFGMRFLVARLGAQVTKHERWHR